MKGSQPNCGFMLHHIIATFSLFNQYADLLPNQVLREEKYILLVGYFEKKDILINEFRGQGCDGAFAMGTKMQYSQRL